MPEEREKGERETRYLQLCGFLRLRGLLLVYSSSSVLHLDDGAASSSFHELSRAISLPLRVKRPACALSVFECFACVFGSLVPSTAGRYPILELSATEPPFSAAPRAHLPYSCSVELGDGPFEEQEARRRGG